MLIQEVRVVEDIYYIINNKYLIILQDKVLYNDTLYYKSDVVKLVSNVNFVIYKDKKIELEVYKNETNNI